MLEFLKPFISDWIWKGEYLHAFQPAVDHSGGVPVLVHVLSDQMSEADQKLCGFWNAVIRPGCEVELTNWTDLCCFYLEDKKGNNQTVTI